MREEQLTKGVFMKHSGLALSFLLCVTFVCGGCSNTTPAKQHADPSVDMQVREITIENEDEINMLDKARSAVVGIAVDLKNGYAIGSGVALAENGYILTNNHVVEDGNSITLYYADKTTGSAKVLWKDAGLDLAILKSSRAIPYLRAGNSKSLRVGETVYAMGTPLTLQFKHTVTKGIVSALDRTLEVEGNAGSIFLQSLVQHDASINPGNSGGPLINASGEVVGINTLKATEGEGIGFASPIEVGISILSRIQENNEYKAPYLGVFGFDSDIAQVYGESIGKTGVFVISANGPALQAGLQKGDVITNFGDNEISSMQSLRVALFQHDPGDIVLIQFDRDGMTYSSSLQLTQKN